MIDPSLQELFELRYKKLANASKVISYVTKSNENNLGFSFFKLAAKVKTFCRQINICFGRRSRYFS